MNNDASLKEGSLQDKIDQSMKSAGLLFGASAILWLIIGSFFGFISSIKLHDPTFLDSCSWFTYGRTQAIFGCAMAYGWACNAIFAVGLWIMARLSFTEVKHGGLLICGGLIWNLSLTIGLISIAGGYMSSLEWIEMPGGVCLAMLFSYALIGVWASILFKNRKSKEIYISQLYILAGFFWFPWILSAATLILFYTDARGTVQSVVHGWYAHNFFGMWLTPLGLAAAYYFIPKLLKRPINKYYLAALGFWSLALFYSWGAGRILINGPVPSWVQAAGTIASVLMFVPALITLINVNWTVIPYMKEVHNNYILRFVVFGAFSFTIFGVLSSVTATPNVIAFKQFTFITEALNQLGIYAFFSMLMFGSLYFILPKLAKADWPSASLLQLHFWASAIGAVVLIVALWSCGRVHGALMNDPSVNFLEISAALKPYLIVRTFAVFLLVIGHLAFAVNFVKLLISSCACCFAKQECSSIETAKSVS